MAHGPNATRAQDMIVPEVFGDMVAAEFPGKLVFGSGLFSNIFTDLEGVPGDTLHFPKFNALGDAADVAENEDLPIERLTTADDTATIKEAGKAVEITDRAILHGMGDPVSEAARQLGIVVARKIDADLQASILAAPAGTKTRPVAAGAFGNDDMWAMRDLFGEDGADPLAFSAYVLNSARHAEIRSSDEFNSADAVGSGNQVLVRGYVGSFGGVPVIVSDRLPALKVLLLKGKPLGLAYKRRPIVESDRDILARVNLITTNVHYGTKVVTPADVAVATIAAS
jgi:N4-gp56 family major capsid protein